MHLVWLMLRSAFDPNSIFSRYSRLADREERLSRSKWIQSNLIESNAELHMNLMTEFSSAHVKYSVWPGPKRGRKGEFGCATGALRALSHALTPLLLLLRMPAKSAFAGYCHAGHFDFYESNTIELTAILSKRQQRATVDSDVESSSLCRHIETHLAWPAKIDVWITAAFLSRKGTV